MRKEPADDQQDGAGDETRRRGALVLRSLPILLIPVLMVAVALVVIRLAVPVSEMPGEAPTHAARVVPLIVAGVFLTALIVLVRIGRPTVSAILLLAIWTLFTTLITLRGDLTGPGPALFVIPICAAGLLIDGLASRSMAALATVLVASLAWLEFRGIPIGVSQQAPASTALFLSVARPIWAAGIWTGLYWTVALLTSLLAGGLQRALRQSRASEQALRDLSSQLEERVASQKVELERLLQDVRNTATLEERTRLARDIHDTLAQGLTGVVVQLGATQRALSAAPDEAAEHLDVALWMARESLAEARRSVWNLRSPSLQDAGLEGALRTLATGQMGVRVVTRFEVRGHTQPLSPQVESTLLRVAQEALTNVVKHANATEANVVLEYGADNVSLTIRDNGVGFDPGLLEESAAAPGLGRGLGLLGMRERVAGLGGVLNISGAGGAEIVAVIPCTRNGDPAGQSAVRSDQGVGG